MQYTTLKTIATVISLFVFGILVSCGKDDDDDIVPNAYAIGSSNNLLIFNVSDPSVTASHTITGLQPGETIVGIDIRPANGQLYGVGSTSRLYTIDPNNGQATVISSAPFSVPLEGTLFGVDFNPMVDRLRIVSNLDQNIRINPETGGLAGSDTDITPPASTVSAVAYSNSFTGASSTILYDIDPATDQLYKQDPANNGTLVPVGPLGIDVDGNNGFDISGNDNKAYALLAAGPVTKLYTINLQTGAATAISDFSSSVKGLALKNVK